MTTYNWTVSQLERQADTGGVTVCHWRLDATGGDYTAGSYGSAGFTPDATSANFKPYDELTEADVLAWVWASVDKAETEANLATQIEAQKAPATVTGTPW